MTTLTTHLQSLGACDPAVTWAAGRPLSAATWRACKRGDWLLWYAVRIGVDRKTIVLAACACARTALQRVPAGEDRPRIAIETAERWTRGEAPLADVRAAAYAAYAAADAADYAAADAAAYAAHAAHAAHAGHAGHAAYAVHARTASLARMATLVRKHITWSACVAARKETR